jgi:hypothetical protein
LLAAGLIFFDGETSPAQGLCTQNRKELSCDFGGENAFRVAGAGEIAAGKSISGDR